MSRRLWSIPDVVFCLLVGAGFSVAGSWLNDPGSPWHLRLGRDVLSTGAVPHVDSLTWTKAGAAWVDQSWLFDVLLAWVVGLGGWSAAVAISIVTIALIYRGIAASILDGGVSPLAALGATAMAAAVGAIHFLVRPHLVTFALSAWTFHACRCQHEGRSRRALWTIPPLMVVWANCHGGFLAGPVILATAWIAEAVSGSWTTERKAKLRELAIVGVLTGLATFATPYGIDLHRHVVGLLWTTNVTDLIDEYQPAPFGQPKARALEWLVLGLIALPSLTGRRISRFDLVQGLVWLHFALASFRQAPLFGMAIAPALGALIDGLFADPQPDPDVGTHRPWYVPAVVAAGLAIALACGWSPARRDPEKWPIAGLAALRDQPTTTVLFHEQDWGGLIEAEAAPTRPAYIDDRFELFGRKMILEYVAALEGGPVWDDLDAARKFDLVLIRPSRPLATRLMRESAWKVIHRDEASILFARVNPSAR